MLSLKTSTVNTVYAPTFSPKRAKAFKNVKNGLKTLMHTFYIKKAYTCLYKQKCLIKFSSYQFLAYNTLRLELLKVLTFESNQQ